MEEKRNRPEPHRNRGGVHHGSRQRLEKKVESVVVKQLMRIVGLLFILAAIFFAVTSTDKLVSLAKNLRSAEKVVVSAPASPATSVQQPVAVSTQQVVPVSYYLMMGALLATALLLLELSRRLHWRLFPRLLLILFYSALLLLTKQFGWHIHILFPLLLIFGLALFRNGISLHATLAIKINVFLAWSIFILWFFLQIMLGKEPSQVLPFFIYASLFFLLFLGSGVFKGFKGNHKYASYSELFTASMNIAIFLVLTFLVMVKFEMRGYLWIVPLITGILLTALLFLSDRANLAIHRAPYIFSVLVTMSLVLPLLFPLNFFFLFSAGFSVLLMLYARYSGSQVAVILSLFFMAAVFMIYCYYWVFQYGPVVITGSGAINSALYSRGFIASLVIIINVLNNILLLKGIEISLSKDWFKKSSYLRIFKGIMLLVSYLAGLWMVFYPLMSWLANDMAPILAWFSYSSLYFMVALPILHQQKSSYLRPLFWFSMLLTASYPLLVHVFVVELRHGFLEHATISATPFWFHYVALLLLVANVVVGGRLVPSLFKENPIMVKGFWGYYTLLGLFVLLSEFDHLMIITGVTRGAHIEDIAAANRLLPYTMLLFVSAIGILIAGLVWRSRFFRAFALVLLSIVLLKILFWDLRSLDGMTRIILLFTVGFFVLVVSFYYTKIKELFTGHSGHSHHHSSHRRSRRDP